MALAPIKTKAWPEIRATCYPRTAIPNRGRPGPMLNHLLPDMMNLGNGDGQGLGAPLTGINPGAGVSGGGQWVAQSARDFGSAGGRTYRPAFDAVTGDLEFVRFGTDGRVTVGASAYQGKSEEVAGWTLRGREIPAHVGTTTGGGYAALGWQGATGVWGTVKDGNGRGFIVNTASTPKQSGATATALGANQGFRADLTATALGTGALSGGVGVRLIWGADRALDLNDGALPVVLQRRNGQWQSVRRLEGAQPVNLRGGSLLVRVLRIGGRQVVQLGSERYHFLETDEGGGGVPAQWPAAPVQIETTNCRVRLGVAPISYTKPDGTPQTGSYRITEPRARQLDTDALQSAVAGYVPRRDNVDVQVSTPAGVIQSDVTLTATAGGLDAPLLTMVQAQFPLVPPPSTSGAPLDISFAVTSASLSDAMPPIMSGAELTLEIDRGLLEAKFPFVPAQEEITETLDDGGTVTYPATEASGSDWTQVVDIDCPVDFEARWHYTDGSVGEWIQYFRGYVHAPSRASDAVGERKMTLVCRDQITRLQDPAGIVDHHYASLLDYLWGRKTRATQNAGGAKLWGGECVRAILRLAIGQSEADRLNGTGYNDDGSLGVRFGSMKYFPSSHYPLLSAGGDKCGYLTLEQVASGNVPTTGKPIFPAPWGSDALSWITTIAAFDRAIFFYGTSEGYNGSWPYPVYGRITEILAARQTTHVIPDADYELDDANRMVEKLSVSARADANINRVLAWSNGFGGDGMESWMPALRMSEARLVPPDKNAPENSWARTKVLRSDLAGLPGGVEALAQVYINQIRNRVMQWPTLTMRGQDYRPLVGERPTFWGDKIRLHTNGELSDTTLGLNYNGDSTREFRVERVERLWTKGENPDHTETVWLRPLSAGGL